MQEYKKKEHPGWAVRFLDNTWLGGPHGWFQHDDAFYADICESEKEAHDCYKMSGFKDPYEVVPAWEPLCETLRVRIASLQSANKVSPGDLFDLEQEVEHLLYKLKSLTK